MRLQTAKQHDEGEITGSSRRRQEQGGMQHLRERRQDGLSGLQHEARVALRNRKRNRSSCQLGRRIRNIIGFL
ncbi:hypothetical protein EFR01_56320 [Sinorhizobium fredii]|nr:hypothetical protein EFR01_56320 [Sinorhizobium fredii]GLS11652.1 hypothetical protein GCM10007864_52840 [Sinorhizobium fredii]